MANEQSNDTERNAPSAPVEKNAETEHSEQDRPADATPTPDDVKADAAIEDRFEATDN